ncbi:hypothetical protein GS682_26745 [Nostoc sp. B(2019)]|nr:hypothetical protein [Nostoc sp. B(2019)]
MNPPRNWINEYLNWMNPPLNWINEYLNWMNPPLNWINEALNWMNPPRNFPTPLPASPTPSLPSVAIFKRNGIRQLDSQQQSTLP